MLSPALGRLLLHLLPLLPLLNRLRLRRLLLLLLLLLSAPIRRQPIPFRSSTRPALYRLSTPSTAIPFHPLPPLPSIAGNRIDHQTTRSRNRRGAMGSHPATQMPCN